MEHLGNIVRGGAASIIIGYFLSCPLHISVGNAIFAFCFVIPLTVICYTFITWRANILGDLHNYVDPWKVRRVIVWLRPSRDKMEVILWRAFSAKNLPTILMILRTRPDTPVDTWQEKCINWEHQLVKLECR